MNIQEKKKELEEVFSGLYFEPVSHTYTDEYGTSFSSCTEFIRKFELEKDWDTIRENYAKKHGKTVDEVKADWEYKGKYATTLGTEVHAVMEYIWQGKDYPGNKQEMDKYEGMFEEYVGRKKVAEELYRKMSKRYEPVLNEFKVFDRDIHIAGTIDFIAYDKIDDSFVIIDWKSSKKFEHTAFRRIEKMKYPFDSYDDCNVNHYSLQLSVYKYIIEKHTDIKISKLILFQLPKLGQIPDTCECNDMTKELNILFNN